MFGTRQYGRYVYLDMELCEYNLFQYLYADTSNPFNGTISFRDLALNLKRKQAWNIMEQITKGVMFLHNQGEVHRDLKPKNSYIPHRSVH